MKQDSDGTLAGVRQIGYKEVEFAGYSGRSPQEARAALDKNGPHLAFGALSPRQALGKNLSAIDAAHVIGQTFIVCPYVDAVPRRSGVTASRSHPRLHPWAVRKPKEYQPSQPGDLVQMGTLADHSRNPRPGEIHVEA